MSISRLFKNLKYLSQKDLRKENDKIYKNMNSMLDNLKYELPNNPWNINKPKIADFEESLNIVCKTKSSLIRFGDGELALINGKNIPFQKADESLARRLIEALQTKNPDILVGINYHYYYADLELFHDFAKVFYRTSLGNIRDKLNQLLIPGKEYVAAGITSAYVTFTEYDFEKWYSKWRSIWDNKEITIICGKSVFDKIQYNIFDNARDISFFYIPAKDAWSEYQKIVENAKKIDKRRLVIVIAGPTAKPLCFDLCADGYRCLDLGHLAKDYDAYMKSEKTTNKFLSKFFEPD